MLLYRETPLLSIETFQKSKKCSKLFSKDIKFIKKPMNIEFRKGNIEDLDEIWTFVQHSITKMISQGIFQWDEIYPCRSDFENDITKGELSLGIINGKICCIYVLNTSFDEAYNQAKWIYTGSHFRILHRIVVNPEFQNQGVGRQTMLHLMEECRNSGAESLRLDVFSENPYSQALYKSLGFVQTGEAHWRKGLFYLLEKIL